MAGKIWISTILVVLIALPVTAYAHGEVKHGDKPPAEEMSKKDMKMDTVAKADMGDGFIRYDAPTGVSVVLGRENPLNLHVANDNIYPGGMLTFIKYTEDSP